MIAVDNSKRGVYIVVLINMKFEGAAGTASFVAQQLENEHVQQENGSLLKQDLW